MSPCGTWQVVFEQSAAQGFRLRELARCKVLRRYVFLDGLPRNALGKVQHFRPKQQIGMDQGGRANAQQ